jgi:hypothetical protein
MCFSIIYTPSNGGYYGKNGQKLMQQQGTVTCLFDEITMVEIIDVSALLLKNNCINSNINFVFMSLYMKNHSAILYT